MGASEPITAATISTLQLVLPWPPSVNSYWQQRVVVPKQRGARPFVQHYVSERGQDYQRDVGMMCMTPTIKQWATHNNGKPLSMHVYCYPPDKRDRDLGNLDKVLADSIANAGVIRNDVDIWDLRYLRMCISSPPGRVVVKLRAFDLSTLERL